VRYVTPVEEIIPGFVLPQDELVIYAKDQPEYVPLPMWRGPEGVRVSRWRLTWRERLQVLLGGSLWLTILTFEGRCQFCGETRPLQPVRLETSCPLQGSAMLDEEC
jgi:hypothetical protein